MHAEFETNGPSMFRSACVELHIELTASQFSCDVHKLCGSNLPVVHVHLLTAWDFFRW